jgi:arylsulfatase A-like enzyme
MHNQGALPAYANGLDPIPYYMAAIEAMDYQIGRLLENIPTEQRENTVIIFLGDNGTPRQVAQSPYSSSKVKNTLYQGGINTPLFISGPGVTRSGVEDNLINGTDLFATIAEIAGSTTTEIHDSKSFKSLLSSSSTFRNFQYSEMDDGIDDLWTISNGAFKLMVNANGNKELYDLLNDPYESNDLLTGSLTTQAANAKAVLEAELLVIRN